VNININVNINLNFDSDWNLIDGNDLHRRKHSSVKALIDEGIAMSTDPVPMNGHFSSRNNLVIDSNVTDETDLHSREQLLPKT
jgi:hypothetical protein